MQNVRIKETGSRNILWTHIVDTKQTLKDLFFKKKFILRNTTVAHTTPVCVNPFSTYTPFH